LIGIKAFGIYAPSLVAVSFLATGIKYGLAIFVIVLIIGTLARLVARKIKIMYLPRMSIVLSIVSLSILFLFYLGAWSNQSALISISVFPILIMVIITEKFISAQIEFGNKAAWQLFVETLILSMACYYLANWEALRALILGYPELIFVTFLLNYLLGRWTGLRLLELYRFRNVIKNVELPEKK
ncbi:MAG TPA: 7TM domain-containing protein, partial [Patescibacteria group bacterium]|nr:7TM domain-containing protein [Patescibacteria group bacterium]